MIIPGFLLWSLLIWSSTATSISFGHQLIKRQNASNPAGNICRFWDHRSALVDGWIYVDFGLATFTEQEFPYTILPFGISLREPFELENLGTDGAAYTEITTSRDLVPPTLKGAVWADKDGNIYKYGGYYLNKVLWGDNSTYFDPKPSELYKLDTRALTWTKLPQPGGDIVAGARNGGAEFVPGADKGYFVGGMASNYTDSKFSNWTHGEILTLDTLLTYDMQNNTWQNTTMPFDPFFSSTLIYAPVGEKGILVSLGGSKTPKGKFNWTSDDMESRDLDSIDIYDIEGGTWYTQRASGFIPSGRQQFCAVTATASDNSSYNIIIYGGISWNVDIAFSDIYVLSMPSFHFIKIDDGVNARFDQTCHLDGNKMFVIGGRNADQINPAFNTWEKGSCDPIGGVVNVLDVNTFQWDKAYDPAASKSYLVHKQIYQDIGGNENGCATVREPDGGWRAARLREIFSSAPAMSNCPTTTTKPSTPTRSPTQIVSPTISGNAEMPRAISILSLGLISLAAFINFP